MDVQFCTVDLSSIHAVISHLASSWTVAVDAELCHGSIPTSAVKSE